MAYSPKYISVDDIPVQVPDRGYSTKEKYDALELAESSLELDLNDGESIPDDQFTPQMAAAIKQKGTCELVKGSDDPSDATLGDVIDDGTTKSDYSQVFCDRYDEIVRKLLDAGVLDTSAGDSSPFVYSTADPSPDDEYGHNNRSNSYKNDDRL